MARLQPIAEAENSAIIVAEIAAEMSELPTGAANRVEIA